MNIFCPNCENECSEAAAVCPKCGHPLVAPSPGGMGVPPLRAARRRVSIGRALLAFSLSVFAIGILVLAVVRAKQEERSVLESIRQQNEAETKRARERKARQKHIDYLASRRPEGGFATADESRHALQLAERISEKMPDLDDWAVDEAVAFSLGAGIPEERFAEVAFLLDTDRLEFDPQISAERRARRVLRSVSKANAP